MPPGEARDDCWQVIAVARDTAFGFAYPHMLADWRAGGAEIRPFSPLADDYIAEVARRIDIEPAVDGS